jgi:hypothetical protein
VQLMAAIDASCGTGRHHPTAWSTPEPS